MRKPKEYKRSYKVLVNIFVVVAFSALSILLVDLSTYYWSHNLNTLYYLLFCSSTISSVMVSEALTILTMTGFHKLSTKDIINTNRKKTIFILTVMLLSLMMIVINCCMLWYLL